LRGIYWYVYGFALFMMDATQEVVTEVTVLRNNVVVGSVNASKRHWYKVVIQFSNI
jgi:hypothetical protein